MERGENQSPETCTYAGIGDSEPVVKYCFWCGAPLCSFCGCRDTEDRAYCNECYAARVGV